MGSKKKVVKDARPIKFMVVSFGYQEICFYADFDDFIAEYGEGNEENFSEELADGNIRVFKIGNNEVCEVQVGVEEKTTWKFFLKD